MIANSLDNHSEWSGLNVNGSTTVKSQDTVAGTASDAKDNHLLPGNVLNKASGLGIGGGLVMNNEHTTTDSVITSNIKVNSGSTTGKIVDTIEEGNGYIKDNFDAGKMQANFDKQSNLTQQLTTIGNTITDLVVEAIDKHNPEVIADWKDTGHKISTGVGTIGGAVFGGGNVGATAAGVVAGDLVNGLASDASKQLANKISPDQKNPSDPKNKEDADNQGKGESETNVKKVLPNDTNKQNEQNNSQHYDTTTDINKVVSSITHDVIVGSVGAIAGIVFGGGNVGLDAAAGGLTSLKVAPKAAKPKNQKKDSKATDTKQPATTGEANVSK